MHTYCQRGSNMSQASSMIYTTTEVTMNTHRSNMSQASSMIYTAILYKYVR